MDGKIEIYRYLYKHMQHIAKGLLYKKCDYYSFSHLTGIEISEVPVSAVLPVVDLGSCQARYDSLHLGVTLTDSQICAGNENGDSCGVSGLLSL